MDYSRIASAIDTHRMQEVTVTIVGAAPQLACNLARSGLRRFNLVDFDHIQAVNIPRQGFASGDTGLSKVEAVTRMIQRVNPRAGVRCFPVDFTAMTEADVDANLGDTDLFVFATDSFAAQAFGNTVALRLRKAALWVGLYAGGRAGELIFWHEDLGACFRCLCRRRYEAHAGNGRERVASAGATIFDIELVDALAGMLAVGLLTRGAENRYGRLVDQLGDRNFLQVKIDPTWTIQERDVVREHLGIEADCEAYVSFCTIARSDPDGGEPPCPDCVRYLGRPAANEGSELTV
jgi:molybdopterin/thiamine biosynthesis adenylyltransferase